MEVVIVEKGKGSKRLKYCNAKEEDGMGESRMSKVWPGFELLKKKGRSWIGKNILSRL